MKILFHLSGFSESDYDRLLSEVKAWDWLDETFMPFLKFPDERELENIWNVVTRIKERAKKLVVIGMGGSSRGAKAVHEAVGKRRDSLLFIDNIDVDLIQETFRELPWSESAFVFISKSGRTLETITVLNVILDELKKRGLNSGDRCVFIGDPGNPLYKLSRDLGAEFIPLDPRIGGRFSIFTPVGLFPLMFADYDISRFLEGAYDVVDSPLPAFNLAASKYLHYRKGRKISVVMPYSSFMTEFTEWYVQLWGESLGKDGKGQTPLKAVGTASQHAILQLFVDGPDDKFYQLFFVSGHSSDIEISEEAVILPCISGKKVSQIMRAEYEGTIHALTSCGRPMVLFELSELSEYQMGYLFMSYMVATVVMARFLKINPYGQPAVEIGKGFALERLSEG